jgi:hypothetical protein
MTRRGFLVTLGLLSACFTPNGSDAPVDGTTAAVDDDSSTGLPSTASTSASSATQTSTSASTSTTVPIDETSTGEAESSDGSSSSTGSDTSSSSESTGTPDPCQLELEAFTEDPGWSAHGVPDGGNVYGWSGLTDHAGGDVGEIGGTFQRSGSASYYADAVGPLDGTQCIAASGSLAVTRKDVDFNTGIRIGHFAVDGEGFVGLVVLEDVAGVRIFVGAGGLYQLAFEVADPEVPRAWSYAYDPIAASMTIDLEDFGSVSHDLTPEEIAPIAEIDAFGLHNVAAVEPSVAPGLLELWIDDATYTR